MDDPSIDSSSSHPLRAATLAAVAILAAVLLCWGPGLTAFFAQDDFVLLEGSRRAWERSAGVGAWLSRVFLSIGFIDSNYRPLSTHVWFLALQKAFGLNPFAFRVASLLLFFGTCLAVSALSRELGARREAALLAGIFYATRDALFSSVEWVAGVQDGLMAACGVWSAFALCRGIGTRSRGWIVVSAALFAASMLSKELGVTFLPVLGALAFGASAGTRRERARAVLTACAPHALLFALYGTVRALAVPLIMRQYEMGAGIASLWRPGAYAFWTMLGWDEWPSDRGMAFGVAVAIGWVALAAWLGAALQAPRRARTGVGRMLALGLVWWSCGAGFLSLQTGRFHMYYLALPAAGAALALGGAFEWLCEGTPRRIRRAAAAALAALLLVEGRQMTSAKRDGDGPTGGFYLPALARRAEQLLQSVSEISPGLQGKRRLLLLDYLGDSIVGADLDGNGGRSVFCQDSLLRLFFDRLDLDIVYLVSPPKDPGLEGIPNVVTTDEFDYASVGPRDLILRYHRRLREFLALKRVDRNTILVLPGQEPPEGETPASGAMKGLEDR